MPTAAFVNDGNLPRRVAELERQIQLLMSGHGLGASAVEGELQVLGGNDLTVSGGGSSNVLGGGRQFVQGGKITAEDPNGDLVFEVDAGQNPSIYMREELVRDITYAVLSAAIHSDQIEAEAVRSSTSWGDPTSGGVGPTCPNIEISSGTAVIFLSGVNRSMYGAQFTDQVGGWMGVQVSGATTVNPWEPDANYVQGLGNDSTGAALEALVLNASLTQVVLATGLNRGLHTFTAKYRAAQDTVIVANRSMVVFGF